MWLITRQFFFISVVILARVTLSRGEPAIGQIYAVAMVDVDQNKLSTADGHITVLVVASTLDADKARTVGDRTPDHCLANPIYRMVTVLRFQKKHYGPIRALISAMVRRRLEAEAQRLQPRYRAKNLGRDPRRDAFAVTDFDGTAAAQLGLSSGPTAFEVLVLGRKGELLRRWTDLPTAEELAAALK